MAELWVPYKPFPVFEAVHFSGAREKALLGSVGSGKTLALCGEAIHWGNQVPGRRLMISRDTVPSLMHTTEMEFINLLSTPPDDDDDDEVAITLWEIIEQEKLVKRSGGHVDHFYFPNGTQVMFRSLDKWTKIMSYNLSFIAVDEANEIDSTTYVNLVSRLRQREPTGMARRMGVRWGPAERNRQEIVLASNSHGHNWIWDFFVNSPTPERRYFRSTSFDNPTLYEEDGELSAYLQNLLNMPPIWVKRFVMCEFDAFEGQIFDYSAVENVSNHFDPPATWDRAMGMDWGLRNPTALVWIARDPSSGKWYMYREWQNYDATDPVARETATTPTVAGISRVIKELEGSETIKWRAAGPDVWRRQSATTIETTKTIDYMFRQHGIVFQIGAKGYEPRIQAVNEPLSSRMLMISNACPFTQVAIQQYQWEDLKVENEDKDPREVPKKKNDHLVDALAYILTLFSPRKPAEQKKSSFDDEVRKAIRAQVKRQAGRLPKYAKLRG